MVATDPTSYGPAWHANDLKGPLALEEFREGLAERLGLAVDQLVFAGEATPERPVTQAIHNVRSLAADRSAVRIDPADPEFPVDGAAP